MTGIEKALISCVLCSKGLGCVFYSKLANSSVLGFIGFYKEPSPQVGDAGLREEDRLAWRHVTGHG